MSFNKISRARNLLKEARAAIGEIQLDYEAYGKPFVILLTEVYEGLGELIAILEARNALRTSGEPHDHA